MVRPHDRIVARVNDWVVSRPGWILVVFLVFTSVFAAGLGNVSTTAGTEQFTTGLPEEKAFESVNEKFSPVFTADTGSTQLIQSSSNVLSKQSLLAMLRAQKRLQDHDELRVVGTSSAASIIAVTIDPSAETLEEQIEVLERATPFRVERAVRTAAEENPGFTGLLSNDFNARSAEASATIGVVQHSVPSGLASGAGVGGSSPLTSIQLRSKTIVDSVDGDIRVFGTGIFADEFSNVIGDSLLIVIPAAVILIVTFLVFAYRDLVDLLLGVVALGMTIIWTFGFMGVVGIPFSQFLIAVPPLLLAVGIDFGIHAINRYREEKEAGHGIESAMRLTGNQLVIAFFIVTGTTIIGFLSNISSALPPIREFGVVASIGIAFTFLIFGIYLPASKVYMDKLSRTHRIPSFTQRPLGSEGSRLGQLLNTGVTIAQLSPVIVVLVFLAASTAAGIYATGMSTDFSQEDFLPPEDLPGYQTALPEPFRPSENTIVKDLNFLEEHFSASQQDTITIFVTGPLERDSALEEINRAGENPPESVVQTERVAESSSIIDVIRSRAATDPEFRALVERNDRNANGIPDDNLGSIYAALWESPAQSQANQYITEDHRNARVVYSVKSEATQPEIASDGEKLADKYRYSATATGSVIVFNAVSNLILESAVTSLTIALIMTAIFLVLIYRVLEGYASLGVANLIPVLVTVALLAGSMRALGLAFNAFTATILAITIGLGIDYTVHVTHRFTDEYRDRELIPALERTVQGTGGALTGSMFTTVFGIGVLVLAVFPAIGQFGLLTALSVFYAYLSSLLVLPSVLVLWAGWIENDTTLFEPLFVYWRHLAN